MPRSKSGQKEGPISGIKEENTLDPQSRRMETLSSPLFFVLLPSLLVAIISILARALKARNQKRLYKQFPGPKGVMKD